MYRILTWPTSMGRKYSFRILGQTRSGALVTLGMTTILFMGLFSSPLARVRDIWRSTVCDDFSYSMKCKSVNPKYQLDDELYALHELSSTLTVQAVPPAPNGTTPFLGNVSIIPSGLPAGAAMAAGEIQIPEPTTDYPTAYIYTSNRNTGVQDPRGDAISIYERVPHPTQGLKLVGQTFTGIDQIRGMSAGSAKAGEGGESYIIAGGVAGTAGVVLYKRTSGGANLTEVARNTDLPTRTSFVWLPQ